MTCSRRLLQKIFQTELHFTPTPRQVDQFLADLRVVSPTLMYASLQELGRSKKLKAMSPREARPAIFQVYHRKLSEHARMFPIFHVFENAMRSVMAHTLEDCYVAHPHAPDWWRPIERAMQGAAIQPRITHIPSGRSIKQEALAAIRDLLAVALRRDGGVAAVAAAEDSYALLALGDMRHTQALIQSHWGSFTQYFMTNRAGAPPITSTNFIEMFDKIRRTRNAVYHHSSVGDVNKTVDLAERLLDRLDVSLNYVCQEVARAKVGSLPLSIPVGSRHVAFAASPPVRPRPVPVGVEAG